MARTNTQPCLVCKSSSKQSDWQNAAFCTKALTEYQAGHPCSSTPWNLSGTLGEQLWDKQERDLAEPMSWDWSLDPVISMAAASEQSETLWLLQSLPQTPANPAWAEHCAPGALCAVPRVSCFTGFHPLINSTGKASTTLDTLETISFQEKLLSSILSTLQS